MPRVVRCYAEGHAGEWEAICLDLDVAVQGESFEEVFHSLNDAMALYFEAVGDLTEDERARFVERPAPWSVRFRFALHVLRSLFTDRDGTDDSRHHYTIPCTA